jgi:beta-lactamase class A
MIARLGLALALVFSWCPSCLCGEPSLDARLAPLAKAHKGKVAIAVKRLKTGEEYYLHADEPTTTASLIKLPVMIEAYQQAVEGRVKLTDKLTLRDADKVPGSGVLTDHFSDGATFSLRDAVRLMVAFSDNTATNLVLDKVGIEAVNKRMAAWGLKETRLNHKVFRGDSTSVDPERLKKYGLGSTTAREMLTLLEKLQSGDIVSPAGRQMMLNHLKKCDDKDKFTRLLPSGTVVAHKTGSLSDVRTDAGIIYLPDGPVALCVLTADNADHAWRPDNAGNLFCARAAKEVYDYFAAKSKAGTSAGAAKE